MKKLNQQKNENFVLIPFRCNELTDLNAATCAKHTVQGCSGGDLMATCVDLTDSEIEPSPPCQKAGTSYSLPSR